MCVRFGYTSIRMKKTLLLALLLCAARTVRADDVPLPRLPPCRRNGYRLRYRHRRSLRREQQGQLDFINFDKPIPARTSPLSSRMMTRWVRQSRQVHRSPNLCPELLPSTGASRRWFCEVPTRYGQVGPVCDFTIEVSRESPGPDCIAGFSSSAFCQPTCTVNYAVAAQDMLKNLKWGLSAKDVEWANGLQKKFPGVCYTNTMSRAHVVSVSHHSDP